VKSERFTTPAYFQDDIAVDVLEPAEQVIVVGVINFNGGRCGTVTAPPLGFAIMEATHFI